MKTLKEKAGDYFKSNPSTAELFGTSDGTLFLRRQDALAHATTLEDKEVESFSATGSVKNIDHAVTELTLKDNPELVDAGVKIGDVIQLPLVEPKTTKAPAFPADRKEKGESSAKIEIKSLRDEYKALIGKAPFNGLTADQLKEKIAEAKANTK